MITTTTSSLNKELECQIEQVAQQYYRLILIVGHHCTGKTAALQALAAKHHWPIVNINLALSERLLELNARQRALRTSATLGDILAEQASEFLLLDNLEMLFHPDLQQDPLRLLQSLSRNRTLVAAWRGRYDSRALVYATPDHPEYRRFEDPQAVIVRAQTNDPVNGTPSTVMETTE